MKRLSALLGGAVTVVLLGMMALAAVVGESMPTRQLLIPVGLERRFGMALHLLDVRSGLMQPVVPAEDAAQLLPVWSPDGERVAVEVNLSSFRSTVIVVTMDGEEVVDLRAALDRIVCVQDPTWSPDSVGMAFSVSLCGDSRSELYTANADGGDITQLTHRDAIRIAFRPAWSPDGERIAFLSNHNGGGVFTVTPHGDDLQQLTSLVATDRLTWSPDSERVVFGTRPARRGDVFEQSEQPYRVMSVDSAGHLTTLVEQQSHLIWTSPAPNGERLAFWTSEPGVDGWRLYMAEMDAAPRLIFEGTSVPAEVAWSPDSERLAFFINYGYTSGELYVMTPTGRIVLHHEDPNLGAPQSLAWRPEARR